MITAARPWWRGRKALSGVPVVGIERHVLFLLRGHASRVRFARYTTRAEMLALHLVLGFQVIAIFRKRTRFFWGM
jgi:hypothetical protein